MMLGDMEAIKSRAVCGLGKSQTLVEQCRQWALRMLDVVK